MLRQTDNNAELFKLDEASSIPLWLQLKKRFAYLISSGYYAPGDQLPTVRGLAADIQINYNTVSKVYRSLEEDGFVESRRRQGAFALDVSRRPEANAGDVAEHATREYIERCLELGMSMDAVETQFEQALQKEKAKRYKQGEANVQAQAANGGAAGGAGRITPFPGTQDQRRRSAGNGA